MNDYYWTNSIFQKKGTLTVDEYLIFQRDSVKNKIFNYKFRFSQAKDNYGVNIYETAPNLHF